jgi:hypothetical protein
MPKHHRTSYFVVPAAAFWHATSEWCLHAPIWTSPQFRMFYYPPFNTDLSDQIWHGLVSIVFVLRKGNGILIIIDGLNM